MPFDFELLELYLNEDKLVNIFSNECQISDNLLDPARGRQTAEAEV